MNSLQILSILASDKVEELRAIFRINRYYCLLYQSEDYEYISLTSKRLYTSEESLSNFFLIVLNLDNDNSKYASCCEDKQHAWSREQVRQHFLQYKHYKSNRIIYRILEFEVSKI
jgi:hypothetical protein